MTILKYFITSKAKRSVLYLFLRDTGKRYYTREVARLTGEPLNAVRRELGYLEKAGLFSSHAQGNLKYYEVVKGFPLLTQWRKIIMESDAARPPSAVTAPASPAIVSNAAMDASAESGETRQSQQKKHTIAIIESFKHAPLEDGGKPILPGARVIPNHEPQPLPDVIELPAPAIVSITDEDAMAGSEAPEQTPQPKTGTILTLRSIVSYLSDRLKDLNTVNLALIHGEAARSEMIPESGIDLLIIGDINRDGLLELTADFEDATGINVNLTSMTRSDFDYRNAKGDSFIRKIWSEKKLVVKGRH